MSNRRTLSSSLSAQVLGYLRERDFSQAEIARMLGVSESFISLVKSRERGLTLDHIESLAGVLKLPLGALLLSVTGAKGGGDMARATERLIEMADEVVKSFKEHTAHERV
jgi:transcriptional regulator with XRE-family HTH domain